MLRLFILFFVISLSGKAQTILSSGNAPWPMGELLNYTQYDSITSIPNNTGSSQVWNFSNWISKSTTKQIFYQAAFTSSCTSGLNSPPPQHYELGSASGGDNASWQGINWEWVGWTSASHTVKFFNYGTIYKWPVAFGYSEFDTFSGSTITTTACSTDNGTITGTLVTQAPGEGTIILPGSLTYSNCLQVIRTQTIVQAFNTGTTTVLEKEYKYYHTSHKWPLVDINYITYMSGTFSFTTVDVGINVITATGYENLNLEANDMKLFPNPTSDLLKPEINGVDKINYNVYDMKGICLKKGDCNLSKETINVSDLSNGIYFLEVTFGNKTTRKKIVVNR